MGEKPRLPPSVEIQFPPAVLKHIYRFVPKSPKPSPSLTGLQRELERLQKSPKRTAMDLYGLDDFVIS